MIIAEKLKYLINVPKKHLEMISQQSGYHGDSFIRSKFLGMTNGGQFCYSVDYPDNDSASGFQTVKVYLTYDSAADKITLDY